MKTPEELQKIAEEYERSITPAIEDADSIFKHERIRSFQYGYRAGSQAAAPQWISVRERMPPPEVKVLWWNETADQSGVSSYEYMSHCNDTMIEWGDAGYLSIKNFTHWMPLPEPPEKES